MNGGVSLPRKTELDGKRWLNYSISVWDDIRKTADEASLGHPAMFPAQLASRLIEIFSHTGETVLDPFCGTGSTLLAACRLGRRGIGVDISAKFLDLAGRRLTVEGHTTFTLYHGNASDPSLLAGETADLCVTSPPYWDILNRKRTADFKETRHYGNLPGDLGTIEKYSDFLLSLSAVFAGVHSLLKPGGYCCAVVMDVRKKDVFFPLHMDLPRILEPLGFMLDDLIIWDRRHEYNRLRPLGFPYVFRVNRVHEFILIFRKR